MPVPPRFTIDMVNGTEIDETGAAERSWLRIRCRMSSIKLLPHRQYSIALAIKVKDMRYFETSVSFAIV